MGKLGRIETIFSFLMPRLKCRICSKYMVLLGNAVQYLPGIFQYVATGQEPRDSFQASQFARQAVNVIGSNISLK